MTAQTALAAQTRQPGTVRTNRSVLAFLGLLLLAVGVLTLLVRFGVFGAALPDQPVLGPAVTDFVARTAWFWPVVAVAAGIIALLCLWWLLVQGRSNRINSVRISEDAGDGPTTLAADALTDALEHEIGSYRGVRVVRSHVSTPSGGYLVSIRVGLDGRVTADEVLLGITAGAIPHARQAISAPDLPFRIEFELPKTAMRGVT